VHVVSGIKICVPLLASCYNGVSVLSVLVTYCSCAAFGVYVSLIIMLYSFYILVDIILVSRSGFILSCTILISLLALSLSSVS